MKENELKFSGREFKGEEIALIQWTAKIYPKLTRQELACTVCELVNWNQKSGKPKFNQCLSLLRELEAEGKFPEFLLGILRVIQVDRAIDFFEVSADIFAVFIADKGRGVADLMDDAKLLLRIRKHCVYRLAQSL